MSNEGEEFIASIRANECIWNTNHPDFKNLLEKQRIWEEISNKFNLPIEKAKRKWRGLKTTLVQHKLKPNKGSLKGGGAKWKYLQDMEFVAPFLKIPQCPVAIEIKEESESESNISTDWETMQLNAPGASNSDKNLVTSIPSREDTVIEFIEAVKKHNCLWDENDPNFKFKEMQDCAWKQIEILLHIPAETCKKKWKCFKVYLTREVAKHPDNKSRWPYFKILQFVRPFIGKNDDSQTIIDMPETGKDFGELVIEEVEKRPILWDIYNKNYKSVFKKQKAWEEIAKTLHYPMEDVKKKWKRLRDCFSRSYIRDPEERLNTWPYFAKMMFLAPHLKGGTVKTEQTRDSDDEESNSSASESKAEKPTCETSRQIPTEDFIEVMKEKRTLWDANCDNYKNVKVRTIVWKEIADHFGVSDVAECKKKWKALRDAFARYYYKSSKEEEITWKYYQQMKFVVANLKNKKNGNEESCEDETVIRNESRVDEVTFQQEVILKQEIDIDFSSLSEDESRQESDLKSLELFRTEDLIEVVKQHELLWNSNNPNYKNNDMRMKEWEIVASEFGVLVDDVKRKWKALRDSFVRNYFKPVDEKYKAWNYYSQMKFLGPHVKYKKGNNYLMENESKDNLNLLTTNEPIRKFTVKEFINEIKKHTILWDLTDERCKSKNHRLKAWKEIAAHFSVSSLECKRKWATLRGAFIREFAKYPNNATWENFEELDFLLPYLKANVTVKREIDKPEEMDTCTQNTQQNESNLFETKETTVDSKQHIFATSDQSWIEDFIRSVEKQPILWDVTDVNYKKALKRQQAWDAIAKEFGISINEAKRKWKSLRDNLTADLNKFGCTDENLSSRWKYYSAMSFLRPHLKFEMKNTGEFGYEANYDSDSCGANITKTQQRRNSADEKFTFDFIQTIKENVTLWNCSNEFNRSDVEKEEIWQNISQKFNMSITDCKAKWQELQNQYTRVLLNQANDTKYLWKYTLAMDFLRPFIKRRMDTPDISACFGFDDIIEDYNFPEQQSTFKDSDPDEAVYEELLECSPSAIVQNIERNDIQINDMRERLAAKRKKESDLSSDDDEDKEFLQSIKEKIKILPKYIKKDAKGHIEAYLKVVLSNHHN